MVRNPTTVKVICAIAMLVSVMCVQVVAGPADRDEFRRVLLKDAVVKETGGARVSINFKNAPITDVILSLSRQAGKSIVIDKGIDVSKAKVTCFYEGSSFEDALDSVVSGLDYAFRIAGDGTYHITEYEEAILNVHDIYVKHKENSNTTSSGSNNTSLSSNSTMGGGFSGSGNNRTGTGTSTSGSSSNDNEQTTSEHSQREIDMIVDYVKKMLSPKGVVTRMPTGFIYVRDIPSRVKMVREMVKRDDSKRKTIQMKISLVRLDYKDEFESGINWWALLKQSSSPRIELTSNFMGPNLGTQAGNVATLNLVQGDLTAIIKALEKYAKVNVVQSWETRAVSGANLPFHLYETVWYSTGSIVQVVNNQTITTPQMESMEVGLKLTVNPMKMDKGYLVNTAIDLSNLLSFQKVGDLEMPNVERNYVSVPIKMKAGETVAISGFKIKASEKEKIGLPLLIKIPLLSYLFGYDNAVDRTSELTVIITFSGEMEV